MNTELMGDLLIGGTILLYLSGGVAFIVSGVYQKGVLSILYGLSNLIVFFWRTK